MGLLLTWRPLGLAVLPVAVLAAFSRVFVGVHYPHDVVAGFLLGALTRPSAALVHRIRNRDHHPVRTA